MYHRFIAFGDEWYKLQGRRYFASGADDGGTQYELEASYFYPLKGLEEMGRSIRFNEFLVQGGRNER